MMTSIKGNERNYFDGQLEGLHIKNKQICLEDFKNKAAPDLCSSFSAKLEQVINFNYSLFVRSFKILKFAILSQFN
jgi:hypothetical protein